MRTVAHRPSAAGPAAPLHGSAAVGLLRAALAVVLAALVLAPHPAAADSGLGAGDPLGSLSSEGAFALVGSDFTLADTDALTGALLGTDARDALSDSPSSVARLAEDQALTADALRRAEEARRVAQERRRAELDRARRAKDARDAAARSGSPAGPGGAGTASGNIVDVGRNIRVDASIAGQVRALLAAADAAGVSLSANSSYRDPAKQIALRRAHCGSSNYAIYEAPSTSCRPPTARPGQSMHERGLAIDFANCSTRSTRCYQWLAANASRFGMYNYPAEAWHWSSTGR